MRPGLFSRPHLQVILDPRAAGAGLRELVRGAAAGGADSIQARWPGAPAGELLERVAEVLDALGGSPLPVIVNDRLDVALLARAAGVHVPEAGPAPKEAGHIRLLAGSALFVVGRSIHAPEAAQAPGTESLDYITFGHVFPSRSKPGQPPRGLRRLTETARISPVPVLAVGGVTAETAPAALRAGASGVAVISAVMEAPDPCAAVADLRRALDSAAAQLPFAWGSPRTGSSAGPVAAGERRRWK